MQLSELGNRYEEVEAAVTSSQKPVYVICRRGIASRTATRLLVGRFNHVYDVKGGYSAWSTDVDQSFPAY